MKGLESPGLQQHYSDDLACTRIIMSVASSVPRRTVQDSYQAQSQWESLPQCFDYVTSNLFTADDYDYGFLKVPAARVLAN